MPLEREGKEEQEGPVPTVRPWEPPKSPFGLLQETYYTSPWRLLVVSIVRTLASLSPPLFVAVTRRDMVGWQLLNVTSGRHQVRPVVGDLFDRYPSPEAMAEGAQQRSPRALLASAPHPVVSVCVCGGACAFGLFCSG